jgi:hypothetical protein
MKIKCPLFIAIICSSVLQLSFGQTRHALIFAIGNYPDGSGWPKISSKNDVALIQNALQSQNFQDIKIVQDQAATVNGISGALEDLITKSKPGDIDVIHFSSHGEQIEDMMRHKADGLEESIVTIDAKLPDHSKPFTQAYFESLLPGYYREDMFGSYIEKLRAKLGKRGDVIVFLDLCHAGTGTRGSARVRGGKGALVSPGFNRKINSSADLAHSFSNSDNANADESNLASYVVFGAARANELDYETVDATTQIGYGSLSYAVSKVLLNLSKEQKQALTYRSLFARIQSVMDENSAPQHPVLAGTGADRLLFGGKVITQKPFIEIDRVKGSHVTIKGGSLMGLDSGAKVAIYPAGTSDPKNAKLIDTGTVINSSLFTSEVRFGKPVAIKQPADGWVFVTAPVFKNEPLKINVEGTKTRGGNSALTFSQLQRVKILNGLKSVARSDFYGAC